MSQVESPLPPRLAHVPLLLYAGGQVWRCCSCHRILAKLWLQPGSSIEIKCRGCNTFNVLQVSLEDERSYP